MYGGMRSRGMLFLGACVFFGIGLACTPDTFLRLHIMEQALTSSLDVVRKGAMLQIFGARMVAFALGALLLAAGALWPRVASSARYRRFMERRRTVLDRHRAYRRLFLTPAGVFLLGAVVLTLVYLAAGDLVLDERQLHLIHREDGIIETLTALLFLAAAMISVRVAVRMRRGTPEFGMHLFLGLLFFLMFGEEISWGQRFFGIATPDFLAEVNVQRELNFHNLYGYVFDNLFMLCFLAWGVAVPLLDRLSAFFRQLFAAVALPVPSAGVAAGMLAVSLIQAEIVYRFTDQLATLRLSEVREMLSALAFVILMVEIWTHVASRFRPDRRAQGAARTSVPKGRGPS